MPLWADQSNWLGVSKTTGQKESVLRRKEGHSEFIIPKCVTALVVKGLMERRYEECDMYSVSWCSLIRPTGV